MARRPFAQTVVDFVVIRPMPFHFVSVKPVCSMRPLKVPIWSHFASETYGNATNLFGPSKSSMPMDGDR